MEKLVKVEPQSDSVFLSNSWIIYDCVDLLSYINAQIDAWANIAAGGIWYLKADSLDFIYIRPSF